MEVFEECRRKWLWVEMNERERKVEKGNLMEIWKVGEEIRKKWKKFNEK